MRFGQQRCPCWINSPSVGDEEEEEEESGGGGAGGSSSDWTSDVLGEELEGGEVLAFGVFVCEFGWGGELAC